MEAVNDKYNLPLNRTKWSSWQPKLRVHVEATTSKYHQASDVDGLWGVRLTVPLPGDSGHFLHIWLKHNGKQSRLKGRDDEDEAGDAYVEDGFHEDLQILCIRSEDRYDNYPETWTKRGWTTRA
jgi:hypothetical protein